MGGALGRAAGAQLLAGLDDPRGDPRGAGLRAAGSSAARLGAGRPRAGSPGRADRGRLRASRLPQAHADRGALPARRLAAGPPDLLHDRRAGHRQRRSLVARHLGGAPPPHGRTRGRGASRATRPQARPPRPVRAALSGADRPRHRADVRLDLARGLGHGPRGRRGGGDGRPELGSLGAAPLLYRQAVPLSQRDRRARDHPARGHEAPDPPLRRGWAI